MQGIEQLNGITASNYKSFLNKIIIANQEQKGGLIKQISYKVIDIRYDNIHPCLVLDEVSEQQSGALIKEIKTTGKLRYLTLYGIEL